MSSEYNIQKSTFIHSLLCTNSLNSLDFYKVAIKYQILIAQEKYGIANTEFKPFTVEEKLKNRYLPLRIFYLRMECI